jgi:hypothetical protein
MWLRAWNIKIIIASSGTQAGRPVGCLGKGIFATIIYILYCAPYVRTGAQIGSRWPAAQTSNTFARTDRCSARAFAPAAAAINSRRTLTRTQRAARLFGGKWSWGWFVWANCRPPAPRDNQTLCWLIRRVGRPFESAYFWQIDINYQNQMHFLSWRSLDLGRDCGRRR